MNIAFYTARTGLIAQTDALAVHANNISNTQTNGFKAFRPSFSDCLYTVQREQQADWQTGHGTRVAKTDFMFSESQFLMSERPLDYALPNEGFFAVQNQYGDVNYTRDGAFAISQIEENGAWYLTSATNGDFVLDYNGNNIEVPFADAASVDYNALSERIGVYEFANPYGLEASGDNRYVATARSGDAAANAQLEKVMGALERSNVDVMDEMVRLIETQRAYQLTASVAQTADELLRISNNLR